MRIALEGGETVHPVLQNMADSVWAPAWSIVERHPELVPLWSRGTNAVLAATDGTVHWWSAHVCAYPRGPSPRLGHRTRVCRECGRRHLRAAVHRTGADARPVGGRFLESAATKRTGRYGHAALLLHRQDIFV